MNKEIRELIKAFEEVRDWFEGYAGIERECEVIDVLNDEIEALEKLL